MGLFGKSKKERETEYMSRLDVPSCLQRRNIKTTIASKNFSMRAIKKTGLLIVRKHLMEHSQS